MLPRLSRTLFLAIYPFVKERIESSTDHNLFVSERKPFVIGHFLSLISSFVTRASSPCPFSSDLHQTDLMQLVRCRIKMFVFIITLPEATQLSYLQPIYKTYQLRIMAVRTMVSQLSCVFLSRCHEIGSDLWPRGAHVLSHLSVERPTKLRHYAIVLLLSYSHRRRKDNLQPSVEHLMDVEKSAVWTRIDGERVAWSMNPATVQVRNHFYFRPMCTQEIKALMAKQDRVSNACSQAFVFAWMCVSVFMCACLLLDELTLKMLWWAERIKETGRSNVYRLWDGWEISKM